MNYLDTYNKSDYDRLKATEAQKELAISKDAPFFPPLSGLCWNCLENIYLPKAVYRKGKIIGYAGITVKQAGEKLITGCPHCNKSFVD